MPPIIGTAIRCMTSAPVPWCGFKSRRPNHQPASSHREARGCGNAAVLCHGTARLPQGEDIRTFPAGPTYLAPSHHASGSAMSVAVFGQ